MKYLRLFPSDADYQTYKEGESYVTPNVSLVTENNSIHYHPVPPPPPPATGDIVYYKDGALKTVSYINWKTDLGTPVGVITIPEGFAPDGKARMIALSGQTSVAWGGYGTDTSLTNYNRVPTTNNAGSTSTGSNSSGYLPSDKFTGTVSYVDSVAKYNDSTLMIPSPYKIVDGITYPNPEYYKEISGYNNVLSDFSGKANTELLVGLETGYTAANVCWTYKDAANSTTQWYLPAMGELGYMMSRFNEINAGLAAVGAVQLRSSDNYWSSAEYSSRRAYYVGTYNGCVTNYNKDDNYYARPWAVVV